MSRELVSAIGVRTSPRLVVLNGGKLDEPASVAGGEMHRERGTWPVRSAATVMRLGDVLRSGACLRVGCGTCGHIDEVSPQSVRAPAELPVAEVRRMFSCSACNGHWVDVQVAPAQGSQRIRAGRGKLS